MTQKISGDLLCKGVKVLQARDGYRYSIDPFLLTAFAQFPAGGRIVDLGSGSGVIALLLAQRDQTASVVGLELQRGLVERSRQSVTLNALEKRVEIVQGDVRDLHGLLAAGSFDVVVTNPPYRTPGSGRIACGDERSLARHELAGGLSDFLRAATFLLNSGGRLFVIYLAERLPELLAEMRCFRLEPKRLRMVHSRVGDEARLVLVEGRKNSKPGLRVDTPLIVYQGEGRDYTEEVLAIYAAAPVELGCAR